MIEIEKKVIGSSGSEYSVTVRANEKQIKSICNCQAGINGVLCKHVKQVLDDQISINPSFKEHYQSSGIHAAFEELAIAEHELERLKKEVSDKKKKISRLICG